MSLKSNTIGPAGVGMVIRIPSSPVIAITVSLDEAVSSSSAVWPIANQSKASPFGGRETETRRTSQPISVSLARRNVMYSAPGASLSGQRQTVRPRKGSSVSPKSRVPAPPPWVTANSPCSQHASVAFSPSTKYTGSSGRGASWPTP